MFSSKKMNDVFSMTAGSKLESNSQIVHAMLGVSLLPFSEACTLANLLLKMGRFKEALSLVAPARKMQAGISVSKGYYWMPCPGGLCGYVSVLTYKNYCLCYLGLYADVSVCTVLFLPQSQEEALGAKHPHVAASTCIFAAALRHST